MPRLTPEQRLAKAQKDRDEAMARLQIAAGQVSAKRRKEDTRRKILLGGALIANASENPKIRTLISALIKRLPERDRILFEGWDIPSPPPERK